MACLLDEDPFLLLLLRGRAEQAFLTDLHVRSTAPGSEPSMSAFDGVEAAEAWAAGDILPPLPELPSLPQTPGTPPLAAGTAAAPGIDPLALEHLAGRTAVEAYRLLAEALRSEPWDSTAPTPAQDAVRLACGAPCGAVTERLAQRSGRGREDLATAVRAWRAGGMAALTVLDEKWQVESVPLARARAALEAAWEQDEQPPFDTSGNRWTVPSEGVQLRLGRDGRWWPYRDEAGRWVPAGGPDGDPATALATARLGTDSATHCCPAASTTTTG